MVITAGVMYRRSTGRGSMLSDLIGNVVLFAAGLIIAFKIGL